MTGVAFLVGALCSGLAGYIGMYIAVRSNVRTARRSSEEPEGRDHGCAPRRRRLGLPRRGAEPARRVGHLLLSTADVLGNPPSIAPFLIVGFGFGASFVALFAQLGGGIYTKAADVGADLVGKVEAGIPEDDPRNAAVVADLVGDNVGDCAGRGADLFESMSAENIGAMILGVAIYTRHRTDRVDHVPAGAALVRRLRHDGRADLGAVVRQDDGKQDPMTPLNYGYYVVSASCPSSAWSSSPRSCWATPGTAFFVCGIVGILTGIAFVYITQYYTAGSWRPVQEIAEASRTGPATNIIIGTAVGFETTALTALAIGIGARRLVHLGSHADVASTARMSPSRRHLRHRRRDHGHADVGRLRAGMDTFGPITDNAGGITEFSGAPVRPARSRTRWTRSATRPRP